MAKLKYHNPETGQWEPAARVKLVGSQGVDGQLRPGDLPDYVRTEVLEVAQKVRNVLTDDSIVFLAMSDTHYPGDETGAWNQVQNNLNGLHTAMAAKAMGYLLPLDFVAHLGDVGNGEKATTPDMMKSQIQDFVSLFREAEGNIPCFIAIGNHDPGIYYHNNQTDGAVHTLPGAWMYENFTAYSESANTVFGGTENGGYCYRDFPEKKLRVFLLNSAEQIIANQLDYGTLPAQQLWTANALKDLGSKSDAALWSFIVLCHYPLDYGEARPISNVFKAYVNGESITVGGSTVSFSGCNGAKFLAQFHGHIHCFKTARLNGYDSSGTMKEYDAWRVTIPNAQYNRENYYTDPMNGIYYNDDTTYPKTPGTAEETSFVVNVINASEQRIYSFCYGAGPDREIEITTAPVDMIKTSLDIDGVSIFGVDYNGDGTKDGYMSGKRLSSSSGGMRDATGMYVTGFIPVTWGDKLLLTNIGTDVVSYNNSMLIGYPHIQDGDYSALCLDINLTNATRNEDGTLTVDTSSLKSSVKYVRLSCSYIGADSTVTKL